MSLDGSLFVCECVNELFMLTKNVKYKLWKVSHILVQVLRFLLLLFRLTKEQNVFDNKVCK